MVEHFTNSAGDEVLYRRGWWYAEKPGQGFGFDKIYWKHNLKDNQVVGAVVNNPGTVSDEGGGRWVHTGLWQWRQCGTNGFGWWGDTPPRDWADAVNGARLDTIT